MHKIIRLMALCLPLSVGIALLASPLTATAQSSTSRDPAVHQESADEKAKPPQDVQKPSAAAAPKGDRVTVETPKKKGIVDPNRRWIMRQRDHTGKKIVPKAAPPLKWRNAAQKKNCQAKVRPLANAFDRARFYSIQGDRCKTAQYAQSFIEKASLCQEQCPDGFLERKGYNVQIQRNMQQLKALGSESCSGGHKRPVVKKRAHTPHKKETSTTKP